MEKDCLRRQVGQASAQERYALARIQEDLKITAALEKKSRSIKSRGQVGQVKALEDTERTTTTDRDEMRRMVHDFYSTLFSDPTAAPVPSWARQRWTRADLDSLPPIDARLLRALLQKMKSGKTCAEDDVIVYEMPKLFSADCSGALAEMYALRIMNHPAEEVEPLWDRHPVILLAKFYGAKKVKDFRHCFTFGYASTAPRGPGAPFGAPRPTADGISTC